MTKQKKPKTGDTLIWAVATRHGQILETRKTRREARKSRDCWSRDAGGYGYYVARVVLAK